jgi:tripartite-type tricarboxylate transporter receptor subunit TctC
MIAAKRLLVASACALIAAAPLAGAQQYPAKTIRIIASQSAGGGIDTVSRLVAARLAEALAQTVIVDNRAGANGSLAAELTAKAPPDGYTLMLGAAGNLGVNRFFIKQMKDWKPGPARRKLSAPSSKRNTKSGAASSKRSALLLIEF